MKEKGYKVSFEVDDDNIITFTGRINPKAYRNKPVEQIWSAMYNSTRRLVEAWEKHNE